MRCDTSSTYDRSRSDPPRSSGDASGNALAVPALAPVARGRGRGRGRGAVIKCPTCRKRKRECGLDCAEGQQLRLAAAAAAQAPLTSHTPACCLLAHLAHTSRFVSGSPRVSPGGCPPRPATGTHRGASSSATRALLHAGSVGLAASPSYSSIHHTHLLHHTHALTNQYLNFRCMPPTSPTRARPPTPSLVPLQHPKGRQAQRERCESESD